MVPSWRGAAGPPPTGTSAGRGAYERLNRIVERSLIRTTASSGESVSTRRHVGGVEGALAQRPGPVALEARRRVQPLHDERCPHAEGDREPDGYERAAAERGQGGARREQQETDDHAALGHRIGYPGTSLAADHIQQWRDAQGGGGHQEGQDGDRHPTEQRDGRDVPPTNDELGHQQGHPRVDRHEIAHAVDSREPDQRHIASAHHPMARRSESGSARRHHATAATRNIVHGRK